MNITGNQLMFIIFSTVIIIFSILTVTSRRILRGATFLLFVLVATAGLYFMLNYQFLAAVQLTLYAGGIIVLIIFMVILEVNWFNSSLPKANTLPHPEEPCLTALSNKECNIRNSEFQDLMVNPLFMNNTFRCIRN